MKATRLYWNNREKLDLFTTKAPLGGFSFSRDKSPHDLLLGKYYGEDTVHDIVLPGKHSLVKVFVQGFSALPWPWPLQTLIATSLYWPAELAPTVLLKDPVQCNQVSLFWSVVVETFIDFLQSTSVGVFFDDMVTEPVTTTSFTIISAEQEAPSAFPLVTE